MGHVGVIILLFYYPYFIVIILLISSSTTGHGDKELAYKNMYARVVYQYSQVLGIVHIRTWTTAPAGRGNFLKCGSAKM